MLPNDFHSPDRTYRTRICVLVSEDPIAGFISQSTVHMCDGCERPIWVDEKQKMPDIPPPWRLDGDVNICIDCFAEVAQKSEHKPVFLEQPD